MERRVDGRGRRSRSALGCVPLPLPRGRPVAPVSSNGVVCPVESPASQAARHTRRRRDVAHASHPATTRRRSRVTRLRSEMQHAARGRSRDKRVINRRRSSLNCVIRSHDERGADTTSCKRYRNGKQGLLPAWLCGSGRPMPPRVMATIHVGHASFGLDPPNARVSFTHASSRGARARERAGPPTQTPPSRRCYHSLQDALCSTAAAGAAADA